MSNNNLKLHPPVTQGALWCSWLKHLYLIRAGLYGDPVLTPTCSHFPIQPISLSLSLPVSPHCTSTRKAKSQKYVCLPVSGCLCCVPLKPVNLCCSVVILLSRNNTWSSTQQQRLGQSWPRPGWHAARIRAVSGPGLSPSWVPPGLCYVSHSPVLRQGVCEINPIQSQL